MHDDRIELSLERARLYEGGADDPVPSDFRPFDMTVDTRLSAEHVLAAAREVLAVVISAAARGGEWPSDEAWAAKLPRWFIDACGPEDEARWSVGGFVYWFSSDRREWWWWGATVIAPDRFVVRLATFEVSPPREALEWLLTVAGASNIEV